MSTAVSRSASAGSSPRACASSRTELSMPRRGWTICSRKRRSSGCGVPRRGRCRACSCRRALDPRPEVAQLRDEVGTGVACLPRGGLLAEVREGRCRADGAQRLRAHVGRRVAAEAGVSKPTIYLRYPSNDALATAALANRGRGKRPRRQLRLGRPLEAVRRRRPAPDHRPAAVLGPQGRRAGDRGARPLSAVIGVRSSGRERSTKVVPWPSPCRRRSGGLAQTATLSAMEEELAAL